MMDVFLIKIIIAGCSLAIMAGCIGNFIVWRRMAYFGDSLAHCSLLGIVIGIMAGIQFNLAIIFICIFFTFIIIILQRIKILAIDTILGILAHSSLAIGFVALHFIYRPNFDLHSVLFGNILTITQTDLYLIIISSIVVCLFVYSQWSQLLLITISEELARAEGIQVARYHILLMILLSIIVAVSIQIIGILLITSLLIIPAATSRMMAQSPKAMTFLSILFALCAVILGIIFSFHYDITVGPMIVVVCFMQFFLIAVFNFIRIK